MLKMETSAAALGNDGCCGLANYHGAYCGWYCQQQGLYMRYWTCNNGLCKCYECTAGATCYSSPWLCSSYSSASGCLV
ncbi:MAG: hypothetical protein RL219_603 [Actinomycetota bacterium]